jgi:hypothetical protein
MGFDFQKYEGGGAYLAAAEKKAVAEAGIPFVIKSVKEGEYDGAAALRPRHRRPEPGDGRRRGAPPGVPHRLGRRVARPHAQGAQGVPRGRRRRGGQGQARQGRPLLHHPPGVDPYDHRARPGVAIWPLGMPDSGAASHGRPLCRCHGVRWTRDAAQDRACAVKRREHGWRCSRHPPGQLRANEAAPASPHRPETGAYRGAGGPTP